MAQIINNPEVPHISPINNGLSPGTLIRIQGTAAPTAQRFNINLQCGPNVSPRDDIALHLSVRVADNCIGRNILDKQMWGEEQNQGANPIGAGQQFEILILCDQMDYKIAINGQHFCEFPHKIPFNRVSHLTIDGDVSMRLLSYEMTAPPPPVAAAGPPPSGPMPGYGAPPMYGPPAGPYGGYGPPPPPGHADADKSGSGIEGFLGQAGTAIAGAFGQAVLQGALSGKQNPNTPQPTQPTGQTAGAGGLGSIGSFLASTLASQQPQQPQQPQHPQPTDQTAGAGGLGSIGSFLASTLASHQQPQQPQQPQHPLPGGYGGQSVGGLGSIGSFLTSTLTNTVLKPQQQPK